MSHRIETKVSITAQGTCLARTVSYYEKDSNYKSDDYVAPVMGPPFLGFLAKHDFSRKLLKNCFLKAPGKYEYLIARTKFIDAMFKNMGGNVEQIVVFGAGFDSRAIRFQKELKNATVFELDAPVTQQAKRERIRGANIQLPENLKFISIDFNKEAVSEKLDEAGFKQNKTCLFLLEGLTMYLNQTSIDQTFQLIDQYTGQDSLIIFDYVSASMVRQEQLQNDPQVIKHYQVLAKAGEKPGFAIDGHIQDFLAKYNLALMEELDSVKLAERYFGEEDLGLLAKKFRIITAKKSG